MTEMEERVARALCETDMLEMLRTGMVADQCSPLEAALAAPGAIDELWPNYVQAARAAVAAMGEPTPQMVGVGWAKQGGGDNTPAEVETSYRAMIDAALGGEG